jgi:hypothetical protein
MSPALATGFPLILVLQALGPALLRMIDVTVVCHRVSGAGRGRREVRLRSRNRRVRFRGGILDWDKGVERCGCRGLFTGSTRSPLDGSTLKVEVNVTAASKRPRRNSASVKQSCSKPCQRAYQCG